MKQYLTRAQLTKMINSGRINLTETQEVKCYPKPLGSLCKVSVCNTTGANMLMNSQSEFIDSDFGKYLSEFGIDGDFILRINTNVRGTNKWLSYNLNNKPFKDWYTQIAIYQFEANQKVKPSALHYNLISPIMIPYGQLYSRNNELSKFDDYDGLVAEVADIDGEVHQFYFVPTRYVDGKVCSVIYNDEGTVEKVIVKIVHLNRDYILPVTTFTTKTKAVINRHDVVTGQSIVIQYTSYFAGNRLSNFAAPILVNFKK